MIKNDLKDGNDFNEKSQEPKNKSQINEKVKK
jgi:hypothetical protein